MWRGFFKRFNPFLVLLYRQGIAGRLAQGKVSRKKGNDGRIRTVNKRRRNERKRRRNALNGENKGGGLELTDIAVCIILKGEDAGTEMARGGLRTRRECGLHRK